MPGFFISNSQELTALEDYDNSRCVKGVFQDAGWTVQRNTLNKFIGDKVFTSNERYILVFDGIVFDKEQWIRQIGATGWEQAMLCLVEKDPVFFRAFRGCFAGAVFDKAKQQWTVFTDPIGNHGVFTYVSEGYIAIGSQVGYFRDWMNTNGIQRKINPDWENDMLSFGYVLDTHSILQGVERVYPGSYRTIDAKGTVRDEAYYVIRKESVKKSEDEWIELLETTFQQAVDRICRKCREYGYSLVVDVSGGLDSRMIIAHLSDEIKQHAIGINYAQTRSPDQRIALKVAQTVSLPLIQYPMDGGDCLMEADEFIRMNQGMNYYAGISGGKKMLELLDRETYGMEIWGILGDVYEGAMITEPDLSVLWWDFDRYRVNHKFPVYNPEGYSREYSDLEVMWFSIRGMICGQNTAFIRQNFVECPGPFGDVDFMNLLFAIPYELRTKGRLLQKWFVKKYPDLAAIPYSATGVRISVTEQEEKQRRIPFRINRKIQKMIGVENATDSMNPLDEWYSQNPRLREYMQQYYSDHIHALDGNLRLRDAVGHLFFDEDSAAIDKILGITILSAVTNYLG